MGDLSADLIVMGAGLTGLALAAAAGSAGLDVFVLDRVDPERRPADPRVTAIARGAQPLLTRAGTWPALEAVAQPIWRILAGETGMPVQVAYDAAALDSLPLGWIVANDRLHATLLNRSMALPTVQLAAPAVAERLERTAAGVALQLADGRRIRAPLVAACEGRSSSIRDAAGLALQRHAYHQVGMVASFAHAEPHDGLAIERFFPDGPLALLPERGTAEHPHRTSMVWALAEPAASAVVALDDAAFTAEVVLRSQGERGALQLAGPRRSWPLALDRATGLTAERLVLVGDTARGIHPIAGQGWNLALRDVALLVELLADAARLGLDLGGDALLDRYTAGRAPDGWRLIGATHGINALFATDLAPVAAARNLGLALIDRSPALKRTIMRRAMGV